MASVRSAFQAVWGSEAPRPYLRGKLLDVVLVLGAGVLVVRPSGSPSSSRWSRSRAAKSPRRSAAGSPRRPGSVRSRSSAPRSRWPSSRSRCSTGSSLRCPRASGRSCRAQPSRRSAFTRERGLLDLSQAFRRLRRRLRAARRRCWRSCCWCTSRPSSSCSARASPLPGRRPPPSRRNRRRKSRCRFAAASSARHADSWFGTGERERE